MSRRFSLRRTGALLLAGALLFALAGDRAITASAQGIDPLEVLNLYIKPNVFVILDTSGSMEETPYTSTALGGDHRASKMWQAKQALKQVFQDNQTKAQFLFGTYRYSGTPTTAAQMDYAVASKPDRFMYSTQSWAAGSYPNPACTLDPTMCPSPFPTTVVLPAQGPSPTMAATELRVNSLYAFQWIQNSAAIANNALVFTDGATTCTASVVPDFYLSGTAVAAALETAMNACVGRANTYSVFYGARTLPVTLTRTGGTATATTTIPHGYRAGDVVNVAAVAPYTVAAATILATPAPTATTFRYTVANSGPASATGTVSTTGTANRFAIRGVGANAWTLQWGNAATTIENLLSPGVTGTTSVAANATWTAGADPRLNLLQRGTASPDTITETFDPDGASTTLYPTLDKPSPTRAVRTYTLYAQKFWNGETVYVDSAGNACDIAPAPAVLPASPVLTLQLTTNCAAGAASADPANRATFDWSGGDVTGAGSCQGFQQRVPLIPCDQLSPPQYDGIAPFLENQLPIEPDGRIRSYQERNDGTGFVTANPVTGGVIASGGTPLAQSLNDIRPIFTGLWTTGQATPPVTPISTHLNPKEKTIVLMVTDGDQNCTPFSLGSGQIGAAPYVPTTMVQSDAAALGAAAAAQRLYDPAANGTNAGTVNADGTISGDAASAVTTYVIAYGAGASKARSDWIAWGGSGMKRTLYTYNGQPTWNSIPTQAERDACRNCIDAFLAPDQDTLRAVLEQVINQGASSGEFTAQQSLTDSVFELAGDVPQGSAPRNWSPMNPRNRYDPLIPHRFVSTFTLPLFTGQIRAYTQGGPAALATPEADCAYTVDAQGVISGNACQRWSANDKLVSRVANGMAAACPAVTTAGVLPSQCSFAKLWASSTDATVNTSVAGVKRRIYTTSQNGVYGPTVGQLIAGQSPYRVSLWPPQATGVTLPVAPASDTGIGLFDTELGLPGNVTGASAIDAAFLDLRKKFRACRGASLPATCPAESLASGFTLAHLQRARREAREMILAFLAGAQFVPDATTGSPKRATASAGGYTAGEILFAARPQILAESTLATPAVISPPQEELPEATGWRTEYELYRDGPRLHTNATYEPDGTSPITSLQIRAGFGLRNPDRDGTNTVVGTVQGRLFYNDDNDLGQKPVMTVMYAGTNTALHAFRAGPSVATDIGTACTPLPTTNVPPMTRECGGEELWAFVPYDQIGKLKSRYLNNPQKRDPHDYMLARGIRFSDVFVPNPGTAADPDTTPVPTSVGGVSMGPMLGVWRKVMFFGRGKGGKYMTAIDVTAPAPFTEMSLTATGPIVYWNRGNPDTTNGARQGLPGATLVNGQADYDAYRKMGETWSVPALAYVGRDVVRPDNANVRATATSRKRSGIDFVLYAGSGYGIPGEGTAFYSLDPLTGDVITSVDVDLVAQGQYPELQRSGMPYSNAIVANPIVFNPARYVYAAGGAASPNVAAAAATRVYVADLYGRLWKFLTAAPDIAVPMADLGADQPVATAGSLIALPPNDRSASPYVYVTSGNDSRATGTFKNFGFKDEGDDTTTAVSPPTTENGISVYPPTTSLFVVDYERGFRGTAQPATAYYTYQPPESPLPVGRVFFVGTRFNAPNSPDAPPVPPYPCRSSFDSIIYPLSAQSGLAAFDLAYGNEYVIFKDSRIAAVGTEAAPDKSQLVTDEGLKRAGDRIKPPPGMGLAPTTQSTQNVIPVAGPGLPQPTVRFGSTVCQ